MKSFRIFQRHSFLLIWAYRVIFITVFISVALGWYGSLFFQAAPRIWGLLYAILFLTVMTLTRHLVGKCEFVKSCEAKFLWRAVIGVIYGVSASLIAYLLVWYILDMDKLLYLSWGRAGIIEALLLVVLYSGGWLWGALVNVQSLLREH